MVPDTVLPSGKKLWGEMVQDSWWQKESCCSHSYSITRVQHMQCQTEGTGESSVMGKSNPEGKRGTERKCFSPRLFLQVRAGRRKCVSSGALSTQRYRTPRQGETGWREGVWNRVRVRETENGRSLIQSGRERGGWYMFCGALSLQPDSVAGQDREAVETNVGGRMRDRKYCICWDYTASLLKTERES